MEPHLSFHEDFEYIWGSLIGFPYLLLVMSWSIFHTECMALTGQKHVSRQQYAQKMSQAYHNCVMRHFESLTGGGVVVNTAANLPALYQGFLVTGEMNMVQHKNVNWVQQIGKYIMAYWAGAFISGPTGFVNVTYTGSWTAIPVPQNLDFNLILLAFANTARIHLLTLMGIYTSTVVIIPPPVTTPWSGALLVTIP